MKLASQRDGLERFVLAGALLAYFIVGYFGVQFVTPSRRIYDMALRLDDLIPFRAQAVWAYIWAFPAALIPLFLVKSRRLFRRTAAAYAAAITISLLFFHFLPETAVNLRPPTTMLNVARPSDWMVAVVYDIDPPGNLFPSLHLSITALSAFAAWRSHKAFGAAAFVGLGFVAVAACLVKQHFLIDVIGGLALAALVGRLTIGRHPLQDAAKPTSGWREALNYLAMVCLFYAVIYGAFLSGVVPITAMT